MLQRYTGTAKNIIVEDKIISNRSLDLWLDEICHYYEVKSKITKEDLKELKDKGKKGRDFQKQLTNSAIEQKIFMYKIPDDPPIPQKYKKYSVLRPFDYIAYYDGYLFNLEAKTTGDDRITFAKSASDKGRMIPFHQINSLRYNREQYGIQAGFILQFNNKSDAKTYYFGIDDFLKFSKETSKISITENDVKNFGGITINRKLKKVNYCYDLAGMFDAVIFWLPNNMRYYKEGCIA